MDSSSIQSLVEVLAASGPYGFVAITSWAFWRLGERKDREMKSLYLKLIELSERQTSAIIKMETALIALKDALVELRRSH